MSRIKMAEARRRSARPAVVAWRFRLTCVAGLVAFYALANLVRSMLWGPGRDPVELWERAVRLGMFAWTLPSITALLALVGLLVYHGSPDGATVFDAADDRPCDIEVCYRIVSRGTNAEALRATVADVRAHMKARPLFPYRIEVVTDMQVGLHDGPDLEAIVVPSWYETPNRARFKARALHYALAVSTLPPEGWLVHLDEETRLSPSAVTGIRRAIVEEEASGKHRIGQGLILYHRNLERHPLLTLADMLRTGDDLGRFYLQYRLGATIFGMHGSFVLVRNEVEQEVGFDFGPEGSVTEDAFWALREMARGRRSRWVEGYVREQAPESAADFIKQRRRWFAGLVKVVAYAETSPRYRVPLALFQAVWACTWVGSAYFLANLVLGLKTPAPVRILGDFGLAAYVMLYVLGLKVNLADRPRLPLARRVLLYAAQIALIPAFGVLEAAGVFYALVKPESGFHVIRKGAGVPAHLPTGQPPASRETLPGATQAPAG